MKIKAAEHIKLNRSQSMTKAKMKKGDANMISAALSSSSLITVRVEPVAPSLFIFYVSVFNKL